MVPPPFGSTPAAIAAHTALVRENKIFDYEMPSQNAQALEVLNQRLITYTLAQVFDGFFPSGTRNFTDKNTTNMALFTAAFTLEEKRRDKEKDLIGLFFNIESHIHHPSIKFQNRIVLVFQGAEI